MVGVVSRLKAQMVSEQEDEEDKVGWRLEKEVEALRQAHGQEVSRLQSEVDKARTLLKRAQEGSEGWEEVIEAKDRELANLQAALGEMTYESDAAERLRSEVSERGGAKDTRLERRSDMPPPSFSQVRIARAEVQKLHVQVASLSQCNAELDAKVKAAEASWMSATKEVERARAAELRTGEECLMLRRALDKVRALTLLPPSSTFLHLLPPLPPFPCLDLTPPPWSQP